MAATERMSLKRIAVLWRALRQCAPWLRVPARAKRSGPGSTQGRPSAFARWARAVGGVLGSAAVASTAQAVELPEERADAMYHHYDGSGVRATGPALLVRKKATDKLALSGSYYVDMVSNASIDVVTSASAFKEKRTEYSLSADYAHHDALITVSGSTSEEPDYTARAFSLDVAQETFGGMTTVAVGFTRGSDEVRKKGEPLWLDTATHWRWRMGVTQILTPRWLMTANFEAVSDEGFLGSPYRVARVFSTTIKERTPRTRSSRAAKLTARGEVLPGTAIHGEYRYYWDNWDINAHTAQVGFSRYFGEQWLGDFHLRHHSQSKALFYSDDASQETLYLTRNRQLGTFNTLSLGGQATHRLSKMVGPFQAKLSASYEYIRFNFKDFTDVRTGGLYSHDAHVLQLFVSATF